MLPASLIKVMIGDNSHWNKYLESEKKYAAKKLVLEV